MILLMTHTLAWRPILDPLPMSGSTWWFTIVPLALCIAMAYKAIRIREHDGWWRRYLRAWMIMSLQIIGLILVLSIGLHLIVEVFAPGVSTQIHG
ncbi:MAG: hypothetical protein ACYTF7_09770 [Planctomycetota bacterium]|jgi:hypothetical protein